MKHIELFLMIISPCIWQINIFFLYLKYKNDHSCILLIQFGIYETREIKGIQTTTQFFWSIGS